jgi:4'-phosphopantetheinyl transferase
LWQKAITVADTVSLADFNSQMSAKSSRATEIVPEETHVWHFWLDAAGEELGSLTKLLSPDELERAERFRFEKHRTRFIAGRAVLRKILASYLGCSPARVMFDYQPAGKPQLSRTTHDLPLQFNVSHSENLAICGVTLSDEIGVDIEWLRPVPDANQLAERFFSQEESAQLASLRPRERQEGFLKLWTCKEAWLKASGCGLQGELSGVIFALQANQQSRLLAVGNDTAAVAQWKFWDLSPEKDFVATIAVHNSTQRLTKQAWWQE